MGILRKLFGIGGNRDNDEIKLGVPKAAEKLDNDEVSKTFVALKDFEGEIGGVPSRYRKGGTYTVRPGNRELRSKANKWAKEGKVRFEEPQRDKAGTAKRSRATGKGRRL